MPVATITSKGQVTVPKEIRDRLGLSVGDRVDFKIDEAGKVVLEPRIPIERLFGALRGVVAPLDQEGIDRAIAEGIIERYERSRR